MNNIQSSEPAAPKSLRLRPAVVIVIVQWLIAFVVPLIVPDAEPFGLPIGIFGVFAGIAGGLALAVWLLFFSRAAWSERIGAIVLMVLAVIATKRVVHESIAGAGMGFLLYISTIPYLSLALVVWAIAARHLSTGARRVALAAAIVLACAPWTLVRTAGESGKGSEYHWRWTPTPEEKLLARGEDPLEPAASASPAAAPAPPEPPTEIAATAGDKKPEPAAKATGAPAARDAVDRPAEWPGFRGPARDGIVRGVRINPDWSRTPPVEMWRRPIGPGWSSFAVRGDVLYTQEQRGDHEMVTAYKVSTGLPIWRHREAVRFWESNAGPGPRGTPTIHQRRVYAFGATGVLNALDARSGAVVWSRNVAKDTGRKIPEWGFASSPLIVDDIVIVAAAGTLAAYDLATGNPRWRGPSYGGSYSSPHRATIDGVEQIVLLGGPGTISVSPTDGSVLWEHKWSPGAIVQPAFTEDGDVLVNAIVSTGGLGLRRVAVARRGGSWNLEERWASTGLKPYFNDFVVHKGHAYGFDGSILSCIELKDGARKWKGGRFGQGQLVLLADQDVLLVLSEEGELALVKATPDQFTEIARFPAIEGKTWNHPVLVRDVLLVRNGEEMAAFKLSLER